MDDELKDIITSLVSEKCADDRRVLVFDADTPLDARGLGLDSIEILELIVDVEGMCSTEFSADEYAEMQKDPTISTIARIAKAHRGGTRA